MAASMTLRRLLTSIKNPIKRRLNCGSIYYMNNQLAGVVGGSGGMYILVSTLIIDNIQTHHMILPGFLQLIPNMVLYKNWTVIDGDHIELADGKKLFLKERDHQLEARAGGAIVQLVVQNLRNPIMTGGKNRKDINNAQILHGTLTSVSDPRKNGKPAAI